MRARRWVLVVVMGLAVLLGAAVVSMRPSLGDAHDATMAQWQTVRPVLAARYEALGSLSRAVRAADAELDLLDDVDDAVAAWERAEVEDAPAAANRAEGAGARLARTAAARPSLRGNADVAQALREFVTTDPRPALEPYNESVEKYDRARSRFPGPFLASFLGFEPLDTVEVPQAYDALDLPPAPAPTTTTTVATPTG